MAAGELREQVCEWRRTRTKLGAMPVELWEAAAGLAAKHGVYAVARAVGVEYSALRRRVEALDRPGLAKRSELAPAFVEFRPLSRDDSTPPVETILELSDGGKRRMTIRVSAGAAVDVAQVVNAFWSRRA